MDAEVLEALNGSIAKWEGIRDEKRENLGASNCPLCHLFLREYNDAVAVNCLECPVMKYTGLAGCEATPYEEYSRLQADFENIDLVKDHAAAEVLRKLMSATAQSEVDFLQSLLP